MILNFVCGQFCVKPQSPPSFSTSRSVINTFVTRFGILIIMAKQRKVKSCEDCHKSHKSVDIRQSDLLLCDKCENIRQNAVHAKKAQTSSGTWSVTPTRSNTKTPTNINAPLCTTVKKPANTTEGVPTPVPSGPQLCPGLFCTIKDNETTIACFICQKNFHLPCVQLSRRPAKTNNWCCSQCKNIPSLIRELNNNIQVLSAWQENMYSQQQELKSENKALKEQVKELLQIVKKYQPPNQKVKTDETYTFVSSDLSDIPMTDSENADVDTTWSTVTRRRRRKTLPARGKRSHENVNRTLNRAFRVDSRESCVPDYQVKRTHDKNRHGYNINRTTQYDSQESSRHQKTFRQGSNYTNGTMRNQRSAHDTYNEKREHYREPYKHERQQRRQWNRRACFNCGLTNHSSIECHFKYPVTCRTCGELGHKSRWHRDYRN